MHYFLSFKCNQKVANCSTDTFVKLHQRHTFQDHDMNQFCTVFPLSWLSILPFPDHLPSVTVGLKICPKANFCTNGHSKLQHLCHVIQSDMLHVYYSPIDLFLHVHFSLSSLRQLKQLAHLQQSPVPLQFPLPDVVIATDATPTH